MFCRTTCTKISLLMLEYQYILDILNDILAIDINLKLLKFWKTEDMSPLTSFCAKIAVWGFSFFFICKKILRSYLVFPPSLSRMIFVLQGI